MALPIKLLNDDAKVPTRGTPLSAGYDLYSTSDVVIEPHKQKLISTGIAMNIPEGYYGRIAPRSGLSWKQHCTVGAGVIDADYRGEVKVMIQNLDTEESVGIKKHERVAQLIITKCITPHIVITNELDDTERGAGGFGSTGTH